MADPADNRVDALAVHIERCLVEEVADINGRGEAKFRLDGEVYDVDQNVMEGPVVLVRRSDGVRLEVLIDVVVHEEVRDV